MENFSTYFGTLKSKQVKNNTLEKRKKKKWKDWNERDKALTIYR